MTDFRLQLLPSAIQYRAVFRILTGFPHSRAGSPLRHESTTQHIQFCTVSDMDLHPLSHHFYYNTIVLEFQVNTCGILRHVVVSGTNRTPPPQIPSRDARESARRRSRGSKSLFHSLFFAPIRPEFVHHKVERYRHDQHQQRRRPVRHTFIHQQ